MQDRFPREAHNRTARARLASAIRTARRVYTVTRDGTPPRVALLRPECAHGCGMMSVREVEHRFGVRMAVWRCRCGQVASKSLSIH